MKLRQQQLQVIKKILKQHDVKRADLFGSYARGDADRNSDIDILFEFRGQKSLFDHAGLKITLEDRIGKKVDLITYDSVYSRLKPYIMRDITPLL